MAKEKSTEWYIENDDFEGALERLENTSPRWRKTWYEVCETIFNKCKEWAKKYILDPFAQTVRSIANSVTNENRKSKYDETILVAEDCPDLLDNVEQKCYLFEFYDVNWTLVCSKVGTTVRDILTRLKEELNNATYKAMGCVKAVIRRVYDCGSIPAEGLESEIRAKYIKKYPQSFQKNDRFILTKFDLAECDKIAENYLSIP